MKGTFQTALATLLDDSSPDITAIEAKQYTEFDSESRRPSLYENYRRRVHTVAYRYFDQKRLGASFFFSRGGGGVSQAGKFFILLHKTSFAINAIAILRKVRFFTNIPRQVLQSSIQGLH